MTGAERQKKPATRPPEELCPKARISVPTTTREGVEIIDISNYVPFFLSGVNNALSRGASNLYRDSFGLGIVEWRVISMLAIEPGCTAVRICDVTKTDKAAASRSLKTLEEEGYLRFISSENDARKRRWWLNEKGYDMHAKIIRLALSREEKLIENIDPEDLEAFLRVVRIMMKNVEAL